MTIAIQISDADRWQVLRVLFAEGRSFPEMLPVLYEHGLLVCQNGHRKRKGRDGDEICATCEDTIGQQWRRGLVKLSEDQAEALEVRGAWIEAHEFIAATCRRRYLRKVHHTTTRTTRFTRDVAGVPTLIEETTTTTSVSEHVDVRLLRLLAQVRDKLARLAGMNVDKQAKRGKTPKLVLNVHEITSDGGTDERTN